VMTGGGIAGGLNHAIKQRARAGQRVLQRSSRSSVPILSAPNDPVVSEKLPGAALG
jgi:hypothetical protein